MATYNLNEIGLNLYYTTITNELNNAQILSIPSNINYGKKPILFFEDGIYTINKIKFTVKETIGSGKYGEIFHAVGEDSTEYVIKKQKYALYPHEGTRYKAERDIENNKTLTNIIREAIIQFIINKTKSDISPKICGIAWDDKYTYILMERIIGNTLHTKYNGKEETDEYINDMCDILKKVATNLQLLEPIKFIHGDLHRNNIIIMDNGDVKLIDFGFSRVFDISIKEFNNENYIKSKDLIYLGRCMSWFVKKNNEYYESDKSKNILKNIKKIVGEKNMYYTNHDNNNILHDLDVYVENKNGYPVKVLEILSDCTNEHVGMSGGRVLVVSEAPEVPKALNNLKNTRRNRSNNSWIKPMIESLKKIYNPENEIHKYRSKFTIKKLTDLLQKSHVSHIKANALTIATNYIQEKNTSYALDLLKIMLFYNNDSFDMFISNYKKQESLLDKQMYLYGTNPLLKGDNFMHIHWNTIPNIFVENLDIKTHLKD